ncbi:hypothetical protein GFPCMMHI_04180 [Ensifer adhaerens]|nr:hypothetical protein [Ensifer adhaerens]
MNFDFGVMAPDISLPGIIVRTPQEGLARVRHNMFEGPGDLLTLRAASLPIHACLQVALSSKNLDLEHAKPSRRYSRAGSTDDLTRSPQMRGCVAHNDRPNAESPRAVAEICQHGIAKMRCCDGSPGAGRPGGGPAISIVWESRASGTTVTARAAGSRRNYQSPAKTMLASLTMATCE